MNLLLQHWSGDLNDLVAASTANIAEYAARIGVEYQLLRGDVFAKGLAAPCQKMAMLGEAFDEFDWVVMVDTDMFAVRGLTENLFEVPGTGLHSEYTKKVFAGCQAMHPDLCDKRWGFWGGAIWRLSRELRQKLRRHINLEEVERFSGNYNDEGAMHRLACLARVPQDYLPERWCWCSYRKEPENAAMIHIRTKITPDGPKRPKWDNYLALREVLG